MSLERGSKIDWSKSDKWPRFDTAQQKNFLDPTPTSTIGDIHPQLSELRNELANRDFEKLEHFHEITGLLLNGFCISDFQRQILQSNLTDFSNFLYGYFQVKLDK